jgi:hypothetical protein
MGGKSIWIEREVIDMLLMWGYLEKAGAWIKLDDEIKGYLKENKIEAKDSYQGSQAVYDFLESNEKATLALVNFVKDKILSK